MSLDVNHKSSQEELRAAAAAWLARLHSPQRNREVEEGFRKWLAERPEHATAFEHMTDTWEKTVKLRRRPAEAVGSWQSSGFRITPVRAALALAMAAVVASVGTELYLRSGAVSTGVGEQRILNLEDGSRIMLNTATRAEVHFNKSLRRVRLESGEALFEVAKHPAWPFVVVAGDREVRALGTSFVVRKDGASVAVTLMDGKVSVSSPKESVMLVPGERVTAIAAKHSQIDRPVLEKVTAWQHGQVAVDDVSLKSAVDEMNRYSQQQLVLAEPDIGDIRISGIFRAGDLANFAKAVHKTYGLDIRDEGNRLVLGREK